MKDIFKGYYRPDEAAFKEIWESAVFVFDTNILLRLYRWPDSVSSDFWKVIHKLSNRVWLPHQVALEFQRNRLSVIQEQSNKYNKVIEILKKGILSIEKEIGDLNLAKSHSEIEPNDTLKSINTIIETYTKELDTKRNVFSDKYKEGKDDILEKIEGAFNDHIGKPLSQIQLEAIYKAGPDAYNNKRPPGYRDKDKADTENYYFSGQKIIAKYGDVILWHQILEMLKSLDKPTSIVFITDDAKEDWWWIAPGDKTIGPRPELVEDIQNAANGKDFFMYNSDRFLKYAKQYLKLDVKEESIEQAKDVKEATTISSTIKSTLKPIIWYGGGEAKPNEDDIQFNEIVKKYQRDFKIIKQKLKPVIALEILGITPDDIVSKETVTEELFSLMKQWFPELLETAGETMFRRAVTQAVDECWKGI